VPDAHFALPGADASQWPPPLGHSYLHETLLGLFGLPIVRVPTPA
jgi:hypothetical protein